MPLSSLKADQERLIFKSRSNIPQTSLLLGLFSKQEIKSISSENILLISLLETGNTLDGLAISYKVLNSSLQKALEKHERRNLRQRVHPLKNIKDVFSKEYKSFMRNWKKWKCHCCFQYIVDSSNAIVCSNVINVRNPCFKIYCKYCIQEFVDKKHNFEEQKRNRSLSDRDKTVQNEASGDRNYDCESPCVSRPKEQEVKLHKLWLKAYQNVLFVCPCCQDFCFDIRLKTLKTVAKKEFFRFSQCNFDFKLENSPKSFQNRDIYWFNKRLPKQLFYKARIKGYDKKKCLYKIEDGSSQTYEVKLCQEEFFFAKNVEEGTPLYDIIKEQGDRLDIPQRISQLIKSFSQDGAFTMLRRLQLYMLESESKGSLANGMVVPKFKQQSEEDERDELIKMYRHQEREEQRNIVFVRIQEDDISFLFTPLKSYDLEQADGDDESGEASQEESSSEEEMPPPQTKSAEMSPPPLEEFKSEEMPPPRNEIRRAPVDKRRNTDIMLNKETSDTLKKRGIASKPQNDNCPVSSRSLQTFQNNTQDLSEHQRQKQKKRTAAKLPHQREDTTQIPEPQEAHEKDVEMKDTKQRDSEGEGSGSAKHNDAQVKMFNNFNPKDFVVESDQQRKRMYNFRKSTRNGPGQMMNNTFLDTVVDRKFINEQKRALELFQKKRQEETKKGSASKTDEPTTLGYTNPAGDRQDFIIPGDNLQCIRFNPEKKQVVQKICQKHKNIVLAAPSKLVGLFIFIYSEKKDFFRRALVKRQIPDQLRFQVEYQIKDKQLCDIDLNKVQFLIDQSCKQQTGMQPPVEKNKGQDCQNSERIEREKWQIQSNQEAYKTRNKRLLKLGSHYSQTELTKSASLLPTESSAAQPQQTRLKDTTEKPAIQKGELDTKWIDGMHETRLQVIQKSKNGRNSYSRNRDKSLVRLVIFHKPVDLNDFDEFTEDIIEATQPVPLRASKEQAEPAESKAVSQQSKDILKKLSQLQLKSRAYLQTSSLQQDEIYNDETSQRMKKMLQQLHHHQSPTQQEVTSLKQATQLEDLEAKKNQVQMILKQGKQQLIQKPTYLQQIDKKSKEKKENISFKPPGGKAGKQGESAEKKQDASKDRKHTDTPTPTKIPQQNDPEQDLERLRAITINSSLKFENPSVNQQHSSLHCESPKLKIATAPEQIQSEVKTKKGSGERICLSKDDEGFGQQNQAQEWQTTVEDPYAALNQLAYQPAADPYNYYKQQFPFLHPDGEGTIFLSQAEIDSIMDQMMSDQLAQQSKEQIYMYANNNSVNQGNFWLKYHQEPDGIGYYYNQINEYQMAQIEAARLQQGVGQIESVPEGLEEQVAKISDQFNQVAEVLMLKNSERLDQIENGDQPEAVVEKQYQEAYRNFENLFKPEQQFAPQTSELQSQKDEFVKNLKQIRFWFKMKNKILKQQVDLEQHLEFASARQDCVTSSSDDDGSEAAQQTSTDLLANKSFLYALQLYINEVSGQEHLSKNQRIRKQIQFIKKHEGLIGEWGDVKDIKGLRQTLKVLDEAKLQLESGLNLEEEVVHYLEQFLKPEEPLLPQVKQYKSADKAGVDFNANKETCQNHCEISGQNLKNEQETGAVEPHTTMKLEQDKQAALFIQKILNAPGLESPSQQEAMIQEIAENQEPQLPNADLPPPDKMLHFLQLNHLVSLSSQNTFTKIIKSFYNKAILKQNLSKCNCMICTRMRYPMLIPYKDQVPSNSGPTPDKIDITGARIQLGSDRQIMRSLLTQQHIQLYKSLPPESVLCKLKKQSQLRREGYFKDGKSVKGLDRLFEDIINLQIQADVNIGAQKLPKVRTIGQKITQRDSHDEMEAELRGQLSRYQAKLKSQEVADDVSYSSICDSEKYKIEKERARSDLSDLQEIQGILNRLKLNCAHREQNVKKRYLKYKSKRDEAIPPE